ncbi:hypothetical protein CAL7716_019320 [Calothrix sp. PCC 7716]|nr:hypothetical protein CAL7716_019320 [Calothrix sp. PCC 7716]
MLKPKTHAQKYAQELLVKWLRNEAEFVGYDNYVKSNLLPAISWRVNRGEPFWGVFPDYPITTKGNEACEPVWDEYVPNSELIRPDGIPTLNELWDYGLELETMFDIAIQHKGFIKIIIFLDDIPENAINALKSSNASEIVIVKSMDVLNQPLTLGGHDLREIPGLFVDKTTL